MRSLFQRSLNLLDTFWVFAEWAIAQRGHAANLTVSVDCITILNEGHILRQIQEYYSNLLLT